MTLSLSGGSYRYNRFDDYETLQEKKKQGFNDELDDALGEKDGKESDKKQSEKDRRDESEGEEESKGKGKFSGDEEKDEDEDKKDKKKKDVKEANMNAYVRALSKMGNVYVPEGALASAGAVVGDALKGVGNAVGGAAKGAGKAVGGVGKGVTSAVKDTASGITEGSGAGSPAKMVKGVAKNYKETNPNMKAEEVVRDFLIDEGYANNPVSADVLIEHMSDTWFNEIVREVVFRKD